MKKSIFLALAAFSLVATVQGVQVEWTSGELAFNGLASIKSVTGYYYVVSGETAGTIASKYASGSWGTSDLIDTSATGWSLKDGATYSEKFTTTADTAAPWEVSYTQNYTGTEDEYVIAVYEATTEFGGKYAIATIGYFDYDATNEIEPGYGVNSATTGLGSDAQTFNTDNTANGGWAAVPEPTTVALLALGIAAVGLKRKVA